MAAALQATDGIGLPTGSFLKLDGGVFQSNGTSTVAFSRGLGTSGNAFEWTANGGGFAAGLGSVERKIGGGVGG